MLCIAGMFTMVYPIISTWNHLAKQKAEKQRPTTNINEPLQVGHAEALVPSYLRISASRRVAVGRQGLKRSCKLGGRKLCKGRHVCSKQLLCSMWRGHWILFGLVSSQSGVTTSVDVLAAGAHKCALLCCHVRLLQDHWGFASDLSWWSKSNTLKQWNDHGLGLPMSGNYWGSTVGGCYPLPLSIRWFWYPYCEETHQH